MHQVNGLLRQHQSKLAFFYRLSDLLIIASALAVSIYIYGGAFNQAYMVVLLAATSLFLFVSNFQHLYSSFRGATFIQLVTPIAHSWLITLTLLLVVGFATKVSADYSRVTLGIWSILAPTMMILWRVLIHGILSRARARGFNSRKVIIIGLEKSALKLAHDIQGTPSLGLRFLGFYDDRQCSDGRKHEELTKDIRTCGTTEDAIQMAVHGEVDLIYIALSSKCQEKSLNLIGRLSNTVVAVHLVPDLIYFDLLHGRLIDLGDTTTISLYESPHFGVSGWVKRTEDIVLSFMILPLILVPMLTIALGVKMSTPGSILFKQRRYGVDGQEIVIWKFRTMTSSDDGDAVKQATTNDPRVTKFGAFLRRTSLDELPQFINVLMGDMSIVGPRPHAVAHNEYYRTLIHGYMLRSKVKPGITGWAQVNGWRGETETIEKMEKRIKHDIYYIRHWSLWLDLRIIVRTMFVIFAGGKAY